MADFGGIIVVANEGQNMKFAYCGSDMFHPCLNVLLSQGFELVKLFTWRVDHVHNSNNSVLDMAAKAKAPVQLTRLKPQDFDDLKARGCELLVAASYPYLIPPWGGHLRYAVNMHPSLLPEARGPMPIPQAIIEGAPLWGTTLHKISAGFDEGDILEQEPFKTTGTENLEVMLVRCQLAAARAMFRFASNVGASWSNARPQEKGSYWPRLPDSVRRLDWTQNVERIDRIIRAFGRSEVIAPVGNTHYYVSNAHVWEEKHSFTPGVVVNSTHRELVIAAVDGFVCLTNWSPASAEMRAHFRL
jgi:methionyl-tRNA formyltransferase